MDRPRIYLAGPITGYDILEREQYFKYRADWLAERDFEVVNPFDCHPPRVTWKVAMRADLLGLLTCDAIYLQRGWESSEGAKLEFQIASALGMRIYMEDRDDYWLRPISRNSKGTWGAPR